MPCYSGQDDNTRVQTVYVSAGTVQEQIKIAKLTDKNEWLEACLCALIRELDRRGIANDVVAQASRSGLVDLMKFWKSHSEKDETRLAAELHKFSEHEQEILKQILNKK
jgi:hypothetical protein